MSVPRLFESVGPETYRCLLCPHFCVLHKEGGGICRVRTAGAYGISGPSRPVTVMAVDPIEKKPFYHFLPGTESLSVGFAGCNLKCPFCQNHELVDSTLFNTEISPRYIADQALKLKLPSVSFTYSEPLMHIEFLVETSKLLRQEGISPLLITNGCINRDPGAWILSHLDGVKVDLKSFNPGWYRKELKGDLDAVKAFIALAAEMTHLEVVTLVIPGKNDSDDEILAASTFLSDLNPCLPYHLTGYFPRHRYSLPPTSLSRLESLRKIALTRLENVYTGNTGLSEPTRCGGCSALLIDRNHGINRISPEGECPECRRKMYGFFALKNL